LHNNELLCFSSESSVATIRRRGGMLKEIQKFVHSVRARRNSLVFLGVNDRKICEISAKKGIATI
jgi:hypothetical protein